jgi:arylsulfatase A-like enzyme
LGRRACEFVTRHEGEPFFLQLCFNAVHNFCWQLPPEDLAARGLPAHSDWLGDSVQDYQDWYDGVITPNLAYGREYYLAQLELMDAAIGRLDQTLAELGLQDDTLVVYLTDNGGSTGNYANTYPLKGTKYTLWEGGIRVPYVVRWPAGGIDGGRSCDALVSSLDLYPSLLAAAGADPSAYAGCDGLDQLETWRTCTGPGHQALYWDVGFSWAVRAGDWKLMYTDLDSPVGRAVEQIEHVRLHKGTPLRLTDLRRDPGENVNVIGHMDVMSELEILRERWLDDVTGGAGYHTAPRPPLDSV